MEDPIELPLDVEVDNNEEVPLSLSTDSPYISDAESIESLLIEQDKVNNDYESHLYPSIDLENYLQDSENENENDYDI